MQCTVILFTGANHPSFTAKRVMTLVTLQCFSLFTTGKFGYWENFVPLAPETLHILGNNGALAQSLRMHWRKESIEGSHHPQYPCSSQGWGDSVLRDTIRGHSMVPHVPQLTIPSPRSTLCCQQMAGWLHYCTHSHHLHCFLYPPPYIMGRISPS